MTSATYVIGEDLTEYNDETEIDIDHHEKQLEEEEEVDEEEVIFLYPNRSSHAANEGDIHMSCVASNEENQETTATRFSRTQPLDQFNGYGDDDDESEEFLSDDDLNDGTKLSSKRLLSPG